MATCSRREYQKKSNNACTFTHLERRWLKHTRALLCLSLFPICTHSFCAASYPSIEVLFSTGRVSFKRSSTTNGRATTPPRVVSILYLLCWTPLGGMKARFVLRSDRRLFCSLPEACDSPNPWIYSQGFASRPGQ